MESDLNMTRYNEYGLPKLRTAVSMTKIKNAIKRSPYDMIPHLKNIRINGQLRGCSGFLEDAKTGRLAYINVEVENDMPASQNILNRAYYRNARHLKDYSGMRNRYCDIDADDVVESVAELFASDDFS